ncbi:MAG TPA: hypothetical protein VH107_00100 [Lacipirellulaceae bacterium]|jgi:hypothetical protein|nr:hypothetical protein [Lacipirellulaceae bacterium]
MSTANNSHTVVSFGEDILERMVLAVEKVRERLRRAAGALDAAGIPYAVIGGNAVAAWVSKVDPGAARNTVDVDLMVNRSDLPAVTIALEGAGFVYQDLLGVAMFLDGPNGSPRDAVHLLFAGEKVRPHYAAAAPALDTAEDHEAFQLLALESLVRMKLTSFRDKDRTHLRDLIEVSLVDRSWLEGLQPELAARLQELLDDPDG